MLVPSVMVNAWARFSISPKARLPLLQEMASRHGSSVTRSLYDFLLRLVHLRTLTGLFLNVEKRVQCLQRQPASRRLCATVQRGYLASPLVIALFHEPIMNKTLIFVVLTYSLHLLTRDHSCFPSACSGHGLLAITVISL